MNIFATSDCPVQCANYLDDKRVIKMVLESAQLLSTAMILTGGHGPYRVTHANHPCSVWARTSKDNYQWLLDHFIALCDEYEARYQRLHSCEELLPLLQDGIDLIPGKGQTPFMNCTPHKELPVHEAYLLTLTEKWQQDKRAPTRYGLPLI